MKEIMHTPVLVTAYLAISALFAAYTCFEILRTSVKLRAPHWLGFALCTLWPALIVMTLVSLFASRRRLSQD